MIKIICDRCGKEISGLIYYTAEVNSKSFCTSLDYAAEISARAINAAFKPERCLCKECAEAIEKFIEGKGYQC